MPEDPRHSPDPAPAAPGSLEEELREAEREIAIEEIRMYRDLSIGEILTDYFAFLRSIGRIESPRDRVDRVLLDRDRDAALERLDWLCDGA